jgi:N-carbamoylputrescine amidase
MRSIRVAAVQFEHVAGDKRANLEKIRSFAERAAREGTHLILFPECCITGYWFLRHLSREELAALAETVFDGPSSQELMALSKQHGMTVGAGLVESAEEGALYNTYVVAMSDGTVRRHRKLHAFVSEHMSSGSEYTVFDTPHGCRTGVLTCYDNNLVENVRITALQGAEVLLAPHQTGGCRTHNPYLMGIIDRRLWDERARNPEAIESEFRGPKGRGWLMRWLPARAHDNGVFLIFSNGVGVDDDEIRTGNAMIIDPNGRILVETSKAGDDMVIADLDGSLVAPSVGQAFLKARRPDLYRPLSEKTGREEDTRSLKFKE